MVLPDEIQKKYGFLLQPIKDLTKNWDIDVTHLLENYLEELEKMTFSLDNGKTVVNFAEASLLIQGTAAVWSKKVEYLYVLVQQALDMITSKHKETTEKNIGNSLDDDTQNVNFDDDDDEKLLMLDDITITSKRELTTNYDPINPIQIPPAAMLENDAEERGRAIISEHQNDSVCHTNDFWENRFIPFVASVSVLDRDSAGKLDGIVVPGLTDLEKAPMSFFPEPDMQVAEKTANTEQVEDVFDDDLAGMDMGDDGFDGSDNEPPVENVDNEKTATVCMRLRKRFEVDPVNIEPPKNLPPILDPYEECFLLSWIPKIYKKIKSYRIPVSIARKRKLPGSREKVEAISSFLMSKSCKKVKFYGESSPLAKYMAAEQKQRSEIWKIIKKDAATRSSGLRNDAPGTDIGQDAVFDEEVNDNDMEAMDPNSSMHSALSDLDDLIGDVRNGQAHGNKDSDAASADNPASYEDLVRHHVEMFYSAARRFKEETALAKRVKMWDEAIMPRLAEQDQRPDFDIHRYGDLVLKNFQKIQDSKLFEDIVGSSDTWYICRLFTATLQLANDRNFDICVHDDFQQSINTMRLTLQSQHRLYERFEDYTAQS